MYWGVLLLLLLQPVDNKKSAVYLCSTVLSGEMFFGHVPCNMYLVKWTLFMSISGQCGKPRGHLKPNSQLEFSPVCWGRLQTLQLHSPSQLHPTVSSLCAPLKHGFFSSSSASTTIIYSQVGSDEQTGKKPDIDKISSKFVSITKLVFFSNYKWLFVCFHFFWDLK